MIDVYMEARIKLTVEPGDMLGLTFAIEEISRWCDENKIKHAVEWPGADGDNTAVIKLSSLDILSVRGWLVSKGCPHGLRLRND